MKNGLLIWNVVLTLVAGYLLFTHFTGKEQIRKSSCKNCSVQDTLLTHLAVSYRLF